jgi:hypothetical protein
MTKRFRHEDYLKEYKDMEKARVSLSTRLTNRLKQLSKIHPDAIIIGNFTADTLPTFQLEEMSITAKLMILKRIEQHSIEKENVVQLKI